MLLFYSDEAQVELGCGSQQICIYKRKREKYENVAASLPTQIFALVTGNLFVTS